MFFFCSRGICTTAYMKFEKKTGWQTDICRETADFEPPKTGPRLTWNFQKLKVSLEKWVYYSLQHRWLQFSIHYFFFSALSSHTCLRLLFPELLVHQVWVSDNNWVCHLKADYLFIFCFCLSKSINDGLDGNSSKQKLTIAAGRKLNT